MNDDDRLKELGIWSLEERRNHADLLEVFKMKTGHSAIAYDKFFEVEKHRATIGHSWKIHKQRCHLDPRTYFTGRVVDRWNKLERQDVDCRSVNEFKKKKLDELRWVF